MTETTKTESITPLKIELGVAANLVKGYSPGWNPTSGKLDILNRPKEQPMKPQTPEPSGKKGDWGYPVISLHETAESLITELLGYKIDAPAIDDAAPSLPAGSLLLSAPTGQQAKEALKETLGVSLEDTTLRYALVKLTRFDETLLHTTKEHGILTTVHALKPNSRIGVNTDFMRSMARLRHFPVSGGDDVFDELTPVDANDYLAQFAQYGTHFVSSISVGDQVVQVFTYEEERFKKVKEGFEKNDFTGPNSVNFTNYTTDVNKGKFAYVKEYGKILCFSNNKQFQESLNKGLWNEKFWAKHDSVFQIFSEDTEVSRIWLNKNLTEQAPIELTLAPLTTFTEYKRTTVWRRIFKAAMSTVFGDTINPNFKPQDDPDFSKIILEDQPGVISIIATPTINIYKARLDLDGMQFKMQEEVQTFISYGYVVSGPSRNVVSLPGENVRLFGYTLDMRATGKPNIISLTPKGFDGLQLGCEHFFGVARFQTSDGSKHFLVSDGLRYDLDGNGWPSITHDVRQPPSAAYLSDLKDSIEFSLAFGESVLGIQSGTKGDSPTQQLARGYLKWVGKVIPADTQNQDLLTMRFRALDLSNYSPNSGYGAFVPILPATEYENSVKKIMDYLQEIQREISENTSQINQRKLAELTNVTAKTLNENIVQSGELLTGLIKANAQSSKDLSGYYDSVIKTNKKEAKDQQNKINVLSNAVFEQQAEVDQAGQKYKAAVEKWETMQAIISGLDVVTNTFSFGTAILIPENTLTVVKELCTIAQRIQKLLNVLNAVMKVYNSLDAPMNDITHANKTLDGLDKIGYGDITALNWEELILNLDTVMAYGPDIPEKNELVNSFKILAARGKALASAQSNLLQIQRDIYTRQCQKALSKRETERLNKLVDTLHPAKIEELDKEAIDLVGLTRSLDYLHQQMLTTLAKSFLLQDQALQYAWLQNPTPIASYSLLTFMRSRITQSQETERAKSLLLQCQASTTKPISLDIKGVIAENMSNGNTFEIIIDPNHPKFKEYVNLRVQSVVAEVIGVKSTESGKFLVNLTFENKPFIDRNIERENLRFNTPWRERTYEYDVATGKPNFTDEGKSWSEGVNCVTPFGAWLVSLPKTQTNRGLVFKNGVTVDIRLTFIVKARIVDASRRVMNKDSTQLDNRALKAEELHKKIMAAAGIRGSKESLIKTLYDANDATNGWDVVFNMEKKAINEALKLQYDDLKSSTTYKNTIDVRTENNIGGGVTAIKKFHIEYGYPLLNFEENNETDVRLEMRIEKGALIKCAKIRENPENCDPEISIEGKTLTAYVELSKVSGTTSEGNKILDVKLNMAKGAFSIENIDISDEEKVELNKAIKAYFVNNKVEYLINRLDLTHVPTLEAMKPNGFRFKVLKTEANVDILQLFIQTGDRTKFPNEMHLNNVSEPLPEGSETSLLVRSGLFFSEVLPESLDKSKGWSLIGKEPADNNKWHAEFNSAPVSAMNIDLSKLTRESASKYGSQKDEYYFEKNMIEWNLSGMSITPLENGETRLSGSKEQKINIKTHTTIHSYRTGKKTHQYGSFDNNAQSNVNGIISIKIGGTGRQQNITTTMENNLTVTGKVAGGGPSGSDDLQAQVNQQIREKVPPQIKIQLNNIRFSPVSLFAIKNLLFPKDNYINFEKVAVPGDMLVLGNFNKDKKTN
ncbi:hypothetical protein ARAF_0425 [Arsenophonus endosymbiont of Aleurodicus floccissimus]|uniref:MAC/perforin domain-containing protein n=1 Tax=Arsenophonus endosymbiont of Aleurodicus floccissimus TaxID=2152761 RepID=UPI000E6AF7DC|nr:MAC/perforin domain-containing protein [Arsenophonus endosymbiont of Aleurodicus floccissimus]SPP31306.1 hypothetical protein ARAF_0425 [Arsenophonus endosymbiont of Aleurodicus floccissimus]